MSTDQDLIKKRNCLIVYVLNNAANKFPMKFTDMCTFLGKPKEASNVLNLATKALKDDYGIIFEEVKDQKSGKKYICYADTTTTTALELDDDQKRETTLLFLVLSYIFMYGGSVYEDQLEKFLRGISIFYDEQHEYFGPNVKKLITEVFPKQLYLQKIKSESEFDTELRYILKWGYRAHREFQKMKVLQIAAMIMGKDPEYFQAQFDTAEEELRDEDSPIEIS